MKRDIKGYLDVMHIESMSRGNAEEFSHQFEAANSCGFDNARRKPGGPPSVSQMANHNYLERSTAMKNRSSLMVMRRETDMSSRNSQKFQHQFEAENSCDFDKTRRKPGRPSSAISPEAHYNHPKRRNIMKDKSVGKPDVARRKAGRSGRGSQELQHQFEAENSCDFDKTRRKPGRPSSAISPEAHYNHPKRRNIMKDKSVGKPDAARRKAGRSGRGSQELQHQFEAENSCDFDKARRKPGRPSSAVSQEAHQNHSERRNIMKGKSAKKPDGARREAGMSVRNSKEFRHQSGAVSSHGFDKKARRDPGRSSPASSQEAHSNHPKRRKTMKGKAVRKPDVARCEAGMSSKDMDEYLRRLDEGNSRSFDKIRHKSGGSSSGLQGANQKRLTRKAASKEVTGSMGLSSISTKEFLNQYEKVTLHGFSNGQRKPGEPLSDSSREENQKRRKGGAKMQQTFIKHSTKRDCKEVPLSRDVAMHLRRKRGANSHGFDKARGKSHPSVKERRVTRGALAERDQAYNSDHMSRRPIQSGTGEKKRHFSLPLEFFTKAFQKSGQKDPFCKANGPQKRTSTLLYRGIIVLDIFARMVAICEVVPSYWHICIFDAAEKVLPGCHNDILSRLVNMSKGVKKFVARRWYELIMASSSIAIVYANFG